MTANSADPTPVELKRRTITGAIASATGQTLSLGLRVISMVVLARLLSPGDFGLVGMVTAITGFMALFKDAGLSDAAVQSRTVNQGQLSMLFWVNVYIGLLLAAICGIAASGVAAFYGEPRLVWIMLAAGSTFILTGLTAQHRAMLLRNLRIHLVAMVEVLALSVSIIVSIAMAYFGSGYWALVASPITLAAVACAGMWWASGWTPSLPRRNSGARPMLLYGGRVMLNSLIVYVAYNMDKVLVGRIWGAEALGIYGRAYQLINLPVDSLHSTMGAVAFPALARVQHDPGTVRSYFLGIYRLFLTISLPIACSCAIFADDIILVFLGPKWHEATGIFRLLAPTVISFALINPLGWLLFALGRMRRSITIAILIAVVCIASYVAGLPRGPSGVALAFSLAMGALVLPVLVIARKDTLITLKDVFRTVGLPVAALAVGAAAVYLARGWLDGVEPTLLRLILENIVLFSVYLVMLMFVLRQGRIYLRLLEQANVYPRSRASASANSESIGDGKS